MYDSNKSTSETISWEKLLRQLYVFDGKRWLKNPNLLPTLFLISSRILAEVAFLGGAAISDLPLFAKRPRRIFPTSLTDDVTSEIAEDHWERGWVKTLVTASILQLFMILARLHICPQI